MNAGVPRDRWSEFRYTAHFWPRPAIAVSRRRVEPARPASIAPNSVYSESVRQFVRWVGAASGALLLGLVAGSCGLVDGLDGFGPATCEGECDASIDHSVMPRTTPDAATEATTSSGDQETLPAADADPDVATDDDATSDDAATDAPTEVAVVDAAPEAGTGPVDSGCGLGTTASCSACGVACNTSTGTPSCSGATCEYTCNANRKDCNAAKAPDTDGCECAGTACCSDKCQTAHANGAGDTYYDCNASGTYNQGQAAEACAAFAGSTACSSSSVGCNCLLILCGATAQSVCGSAGGKCYCWQYSGPNAGTVQEASGSSCSASCGSSSDPSWN
jgi:hypothetical protein